jgi:hypothetical protein
MYIFVDLLELKEYSYFKYMHIKRLYIYIYFIKLIIFSHQIIFINLKIITSIDYDHIYYFNKHCHSNLNLTYIYFLNKIILIHDLNIY